ncbi:MAG: HAD-IIA family hydrolase [bacterium]|nr:HAD-IIA family hydrolase [bacterium]MDE0602469.1 HAD-IIA family hydrolase [bacterium]
MKAPVGTVVFDLDGVIYLGDVGVRGAMEALTAIEQRGYQVLFCTNNSSRTPSATARKIRRATSYPARVDQVFTSAMAAARLLTADRPPSLVLGGQGIVEALEGVGVKVVTDWREARAAVVGFAPHLSYGLLRDVCQAVWAGARLVATNTDPSFPTDEGIWPAAGAIVAAVQFATGQQALPAGKPHDPMVSLLREHVSEGRVIMVGDRAETDLQMAANAGWYSVLALSGVSDRPPASPSPDAVVESVAELPDLLDELGKPAT